MLHGCWRDLTYAARSLAKARAFTLVCVISLGIGMAPVIAVPYFSRITRTPPPGVDTDGLVEVVTTARGSRGPTDAWSYPDFAALRAADAGMSISGWTSAPVKMTFQTPGGVETKSMVAMFVSANYFRTVGVRLARGQGFADAMDDPARVEPVVIVGHEFWRTELNADPDIIGKTLPVDGTPHTIVGLAPEGFEGHLFLQQRQLFLPLERHPLLRDHGDASDVRSDRAREWIFMLGRLAPGVGMARANAGVAAVTSRLARQYPSTNALRAGAVVPYHPAGSLHRAQFLAIEAVALTLTGTVLLVVCLNLSGMMQVRSAMRERELSIRQAIGASRARLAQHLLAEALILAGLGGALASIVLFSVPSLVVWLNGTPLPPELQRALKIDPSMIAIGIGLCLVTTLLFGMLSAIRFSRPVIISSLKDDAGVGGGRAGRVHRLTAALQVAIAVPLIVMSGISLDRFRATAMNDLGFDADLLYAAPVKLDAAHPESAPLRVRSAQDYLERASGVASVTVADGLPLDFGSRVSRVTLRADTNGAPEFVPVTVTRVGAGYLRTMGIPLLAGRGVTAEDGAGAEMVTVISKALAARLAPNAEPATLIGKRLTLGAPGIPDRPQQVLTIIGVTADFPTVQMSSEREQLLLPMAQHPSTKVFVIARSAPGEPATKLTAALENAIRTLGPDVDRTLTTGDGVPYSTIVTGVWLRQHSMRDFLVQSAVGGSAGGVILMLAALGVYGVVGLMVAARTRELAVRAALGASRRRLIRLILFDVMKLALPGAIVGLVIAAALIRLNGANMGIALSTTEPLAYLAGAITAMAVAVLAGLVPARRAASIQPLVAMRST